MLKMLLGVHDILMERYMRRIIGSLTWYRWLQATP